MPTRAPRYCLHPGCGKLGSPRCPEHQAEERARRRRPKTASRGYGSRHQALSRAVLATSPRCGRCPRPAEVLGHVVAVRDGGQSGATGNAVPLCHSCNQRQAIEDAKRRSV
jgi:5-methylcytosine-specific restriction endonuclease McrA